MCILSPAELGMASRLRMLVALPERPEGRYTIAERVGVHQATGVHAYSRMSTAPKTSGRILGRLDECLPVDWRSGASGAASVS